MRRPCSERTAACASILSLESGMTKQGVAGMAHCHIAEHHESGIMFSFDVAPAEGRGGAASSEISVS